MPVEAKPLFRPDVLRSHLSGFQLPDVDLAMLRDWASRIASGRLDRLKEQEILREFLADFFVKLLGYRRAIDSEQYTIAFERHVQVDGKFADAVLGDFNGRQRYVVALEGKGPRDPLDRPFAGRRMSAVDQGYRYAINLPCDWIIVTSIRQTRLYHKGSDQHTYERFDTEQLANEEAALRRFVFLLGADRVVPPHDRCHFYGLLAESEKVGRELTKTFYVNYANMRQDAFEHLSRDNAQVSRHEVLASTQKVLDRVLFVAFSEDRGLLPPETIRRAYEHSDPYHPKPIWENFRGLFRAINQGNEQLKIHAYNGGLFADDPVLDTLQVSDEVCGYFRELGEFDYKPPSESSGETKVIDVDILGHIFEQSITDLERLRNELDGLAEPLGAEKHKTRRKKEGAFYTPAFITRYIVEQALGGVLADRFEQLRMKSIHAAELAAEGAKSAKAAKSVVDALSDPRVYELDKLTKPARAALVKFWETWQEELATIRLLDPACGSGAFLIEAFDQLHATYMQSNDRLAELRGHRTLFDLDKRILENNLYGVDLNEEAIEICRLSLWIKTAERGKALTSLDHPIRVGNSVVSDPAVHPRAFDWQAAFPEVFRQGGFDVVVGNPPYVRQEWLSEYKPYLQSAYKAYHGMADLYVYFYELGVRMLKPGGLLSFIVTNKWMKAGYGEPLRRFFSEHAWVESVVDFGHAKQIFIDADVFPSIIVARKPTQAPKPTSARLCAIPREQLRIDDLSRQIDTVGEELPLEQLNEKGWQLEPIGVNGLLSKIESCGIPLVEFSGVSPLYGVKTGCNEAFLIDTQTKDELVERDARSAEIIKPYLRGQDATRWSAHWSGLWMIFARKGTKIEEYTAVEDHLSRYRLQLEPKPKGHVGEWKGRAGSTYKWFELAMPIEYWAAFERPKILYPDITWRSQFSRDDSGLYANNTMYFLPTGDRWLLAVLNSPVAWWYAWRRAQHAKDEALRFFTAFVESFPIPAPSDEQRGMGESLACTLSEIASNHNSTQQTILDWLCVQHSIENPSVKLRSLIELDSDSFVAEVKRIRGKKSPLSAAALKSLRDEHAATIEPARTQAAKAFQLERQLSDLVNEAYGLTPEDVALMWKTAPPRMPITPDA